jgi:hypothetical protein
MATVLDRVPVDRITAEARDVSFSRTILTLIGFVFFAIGWLFSTGWLAVCWCGVAMRTGWREAKRPVDGGG